MQTGVNKLSDTAELVYLGTINKTGVGSDKTVDAVGPRHARSARLYMVWPVANVANRIFLKGRNKPTDAWSALIPVTVTATHAPGVTVLELPVQDYRYFQTLGDATWSDIALAFVERYNHRTEEQQILPDSIAAEYSGR